MPAADSQPRVFLVGGGIASLAAAVFMIRDGDILGQNITILEESDSIGGSLDGAGNAEDGYVLRGGRMLERKYLCTFSLFDTIPTLDGGQTVTQEILAWNTRLQTSSKSRMFHGGHRETAPVMGLSEGHILNLERLAVEPEIMLGTNTIAEEFDAAFFETNFWFMWCTTFAFQPWHSAVEFKRYLLRFAHMVGGFNRLEGIMRTTYNQFDTMVRPLRKWLDARGVVFALNTQVIDLDFEGDAGARHVSGIAVRRHCDTSTIPVHARDHVIVTLGSMTESSSLGTMDTPAPLLGKNDGGAWVLWEKIARGRPEFGHPGVFCNHIDQSKWLSFTTTLRDLAFLRLVRERTGNVPGEGGLITFPRSAWLASIVIPFQPHFIGQPDDVGVFWGYGLAVDRPGDFVDKPLSACSGREIMTEILGHLGLAAETPTILASSTCIPCMMPFITSQFLSRAAGDRPPVMPKGYTNLAFTGQFCEIADDVVFTVEYSIRSAQTAVYGLLGDKRTPPGVYKGTHDPRVLYQAFRALHDIQV